MDGTGQKPVSLDTLPARRFEGSRDQLANLRASHSEAKQLADELMRSYRGDVARAGSLDVEGMAKLKEIDAARKAGMQLNSEQLGFASQFSEFKDYVGSEQERRAKDFGLSHIFAGSKAKAEEAGKEEARQAEEIVKTELTVKQHHEFIIKLEGGEFADEALDKIEASLKDLERRQDEKLSRGLVDFANRHRP
jgi:hypothetical protein